MVIPEDKSMHQGDDCGYLRTRACIRASTVVIPEEKSMWANTKQGMPYIFDTE